MEWEQVAFLHWWARGKEGEFTVWKDGRKWKGRYRTKSGSYTCFFEIQKTLKAIMQICEGSKYWEK